MRPLPFIPGFDNDLNDKIDRVMQRAVGDEAALVYAFGERWGPEPGVKDKYFGFLPGNGIHDIHMNQGNRRTAQTRKQRLPGWRLDLLLSGQDRYVGYFTKFQSQTWHTDDETGHRIGGPEPTGPPTSEDPEVWCVSSRRS